tara:strand:+ start:6512 stop:7066 length:555 start_codon:yes stop_codon:yes gene_type:complete
MLDQKEFEYIQKDLDVLEQKREELIKKSREILKTSKLIIYSLHRNDFTNAEKFVLEVKGKINGLSKENLDANINRVAMQEYVEALCYYEFMKNKRIPLREELNVETEDYLCGLCDLTGELVRKSVDEVIKNNMTNVVEIKELLDSIYGKFLMFNLRNGELRRKMDSIKWNLKKVEEVILTSVKK